VAQTRARDAELARAAANAKPAGDADPYRKPADRTEDGGESVESLDEVDADVDAR
jgi:ribosome-binding factor A